MAGEPNGSRTHAQPERPCTGNSSWQEPGHLISGPSGGPYPGSRVLSESEQREAYWREQMADAEPDLEDVVAHRVRPS